MDNEENTQMQELQRQFTRILDDFRLIQVEEIPDIDLYMDQVLTFLNDRLAVDSRDPENDKLLTKTMINNYAKNNLINPPVNKKYSREQMIQLLFIFYMKSFLSIGDIGEILRPLKENYTDYGKALKKKAEAEARRRAEEARKRAEKAAKDSRKESAQESVREPESETKGQDTAAGLEGAHKEDREDTHRGDPRSEDTIRIEDIYRRITQQMIEHIQQIGEETAADFKTAAAAFSDFPIEDRRALQKFDLICRMSLEIYVKKLFIERLVDADKNADKETQH